VAFSFYHKPHTSNLKLIPYCLGRYEGVDNVLKCSDGFCSVINPPHANNVFNIINICSRKLGRIITRSIGRITMMLRVNISDSSTTEACLVTDLSFRKTGVKQSNSIKGFSRNWLLWKVVRGYPRQPTLRALWETHKIRLKEIETRVYCWKSEGERVCVESESERERSGCMQVLYNVSVKGKCGVGRLTPSRWLIQNIGVSRFKKKSTSTRRHRCVKPQNR
jgi:hypothetical protein